MTLLGIVSCQRALLCSSVAPGSRQAACAGLRTSHLRSRSRTFSEGFVNLRQGDRLLVHPRLSTGLGKRIKPVATAVKDEGTQDKKPSKRTVEKLESITSECRSKFIEFLKKQSNLSWLLGPAVITAMVVVPPAAFNLVNIFEKNFLAGLAATFGLDILFVIAADIFLVLADKYGHHQRVSGGPPPWIGPWEYTGYPEGYPKLLNYISYISVGVGILAIIFSMLVAKLPAGLVTFGPYLGLIFAQSAYERLVRNDRLPVFPLVPILFTVYRFRQLNRGLLLLPVITGGSAVLCSFIHISAGLWATYLAMYLAQVPWLYSMWNSNRAT